MEQDLKHIKSRYRKVLTRKLLKAQYTSKTESLIKQCIAQIPHFKIIFK